MQNDAIGGQVSAPLAQSILNTSILDAAGVRRPHDQFPTIGEFLEGIDDLQQDEKKLIVTQAQILLEHLYVNLSLKNSSLGINPIQSLRMLQFNLAEVREFNRELMRIFASLRDLHTYVMLPPPYLFRVAWLPFVVEECVDGKTTRYLISKCYQDADRCLPGWRPGCPVEVTDWGGMPIARAVARMAEIQAGANRSACHVRGVQALTMRPLDLTFPPDEDSVVIGYRADGKSLQATFRWRVCQISPSSPWGGSIDTLTDRIQQARRQLFSTNGQAGRGRPYRCSSEDGFAYLRIWTFATQDDAILDVIKRLWKDPRYRNGLIIDVRANGGGDPFLAERILQLLTPQAIAPSTFLMAANDITLRLASPQSQFSPWADSIQQAIQVGSPYSAPQPLHQPEQYNDTGQRYYAPVVVITDALTYSAAELFAAGIQGNGIGKVLGVDESTGGGCSQTWQQGTLEDSLQAPLQPLPPEVAIYTALSRAVRSGTYTGQPLERVGVRPDLGYSITSDDLVNRNRGLVARAKSLLGEVQPARGSLQVVATGGAKPEVTVSAFGVDRLDLYLDNRWVDSKQGISGATAVAFPLPAVAGSTQLEVRGAFGARTVAVYRARLDELLGADSAPS